MIARLVAIAGPLNGLDFYLDEPLVLIGREWSNDLRLEDRFVSRQHCVIRNESAQYIIEDLNSANGTYVDGERVKASSLKEGAMIQAGISAFIFSLQRPEDSIALSQDLVEAEVGGSSLDEINEPHRY